MEKQKADQLILKYSGKIFGYAVKKSFSYDEAEELCAEMVKEVYLSLLQSDKVYNIEGYVWRICEHVFSKYVSQVKRKQGVSIDGMEIPYFDQNDSIETDEEIQKLRKEIGFLSSERREIVYSFYYEGKSIVQISRERNLSAGTVKWHLNKARNDLKEGFNMKRKTGSLGISPVEGLTFGHTGKSGSNGGPEFYLRDKLNLNIVYSVYDSPKTIEGIAENLGMTPVFLEERVKVLAANGFLVETKGRQYTTYVKFSPETVSIEAGDNILQMKHKAAKKIVEDYAGKICEALKDFDDVYIPGGNRKLFEAAVIFRAIAEKCYIPVERNLSKYKIKTLDGGDYFVNVDIKSEIEDPDYKPKFDWKDYTFCGEMTRKSEKYPVESWSVNSRLDSRKGGWQNNLTTDCENIYEFMTHQIEENKSNEEKFNRMREKGFLSDDNKINVMIVKGTSSELYEKIPEPSPELIEEFAKYALDQAMNMAKLYPVQMQDYVVFENTRYFIGNDVALMVMDELYETGIFKPLTEKEKITANYLMFSDRLPE